jgi:DNA repair protein RadC
MEIKILQIRESTGETVTSPKYVAEMMTEESKADRECLWVLHLNAQNKIIEKELVAVGTVNSAIVGPREVFKKAIINSVSGIIAVHNHPSGEPEPSSEDIQIHRRLEQALRKRLLMDWMISELKSSLKSGQHRH